MRKMILQMLKLRISELYMIIILVLGGGLFGSVLFEIVMRTNESLEEDPTTFELAMFMALVCFICDVFITSFAVMEQNFNNAVGMGRTRKSYVISNMIVAAIQLAVGVLTLGVVYLTEQWRLQSWWSEYPCETSLVQFFQPWCLLAVILGATIVQSFIGMFFLKFGKKAFWFFWVLWMICCIGIPRVIGATEEHKNSVLGYIGRFMRDTFGSMSVIAIVCCCTAAGVIMLFGTYLGMRRQRVTS